MSYYFARDVMSVNPITLKPQMTIEEAAEVLIGNKIGGAPVVDHNNRLIGVVSIHDLLTFAGIEAPYTFNYYEEARIEEMLSREGLHVEELSGGFISDIMVRTIFTASPDTSVEEMAEMMYKNRIHRVIIIDEDEPVPLGVVSTFDLLKVLTGRKASLSGNA